MSKGNKTSKPVEEVKENIEELDTPESVPVSTVEPSNKKEISYIAVYPIRCNGELIKPNEEVSAEELGNDIERLLKIGAVLELQK